MSKYREVDWLQIAANITRASVAVEEWTPEDEAKVTERKPLVDGLDSPVAPYEDD